MLLAVERIFGGCDAARTPWPGDTLTHWPWHHFRQLTAASPAHVWPIVLLPPSLSTVVCH
jgi:hypothetical protein